MRSCLVGYTFHQDILGTVFPGDLNYLETVRPGTPHSPDTAPRDTQGGTRLGRTVALLCTGSPCHSYRRSPRDTSRYRYLYSDCGMQHSRTARHSNFAPQQLSRPCIPVERGAETSHASCCFLLARRLGDGRVRIGTFPATPQPLVSLRGLELLLQQARRKRSRSFSSWLRAR